MDAALAFLRDHWLEFALPAIGLILGWLWGRRRAGREWAKQQFVRRVNVSLNLFDASGEGPPTLRIRTLLEKEAGDIFLNDVAVDHLVAAANRTTIDDPTLPLGEDAWFLLNGVLNEISERYSDGFIRRDVGQPTRSATYIIGLTYERAGEMKTQKVRAMVIRRDVLEGLLSPDAAEPRYESPLHATRWHTLRQMVSVWRQKPEQFLEIELVV